MQKIRDLMRQPVDEPLPLPIPKVKYAAPDPQEEARAERHLLELAGKPLIRDGVKIYDCQVCQDMRWLRMDVPVGHKRFGKMRMCPCNPQFAQFGDKWQ